MQSDGTTLDEFSGAYNAVMLLARDREHAAVDLLLDRFGSSLNYACQGYAWGNDVALVNKLLVHLLGLSTSESKQVCTAINLHVHKGALQSNGLFARFARNPLAASQRHGRRQQVYTSANIM